MKNTSTGTSRARTQALVEVGRTHPPLRYDVSLGLARHERMLQQGAALPSWDNGSAPLATPALASSTLVTGLLVTAIAGLLVAAVWHTHKPVPAPATPVHSEAPARPAPPNPIPAAPPAAAVEMAPSAVPVPVRASARAHRALRKRAPAPAAGTLAPPATTTTTTTAAPEIPSDLLEMQELAQAEARLSGDPAGALTLLNASEQRFPRGYFRHERAYVSIMALIALHRTESAHRAAERFLQSYPQTPYRARVLGALEHADKPARD